MITTFKPRIWGEWTAAFYPSGTTIVVLANGPRKPHLYIHGDAAADEDRYDSARMLLCHEIVQYMNGGDRPPWLDDMERVSETLAVSLTGASIEAVGPMVDADPPNLNWVTDESDAAKGDRARLMDAIFLRGEALRR